MLQEALDVWNALKGKITQLFHELNSKGLQCERYDVTTAPNGSVIGVTKPFSDTELFIPYSWECSSATVGDSVLVAWWGNSLSTARAWFKGNGGEKNGKVDATLSLNGYLGYRAIEREDIPSNADLNDYWRPGHYRVTSDAKAGTLVNRPTSYAFIMDVYGGTGSNELSESLGTYRYYTQRVENRYGSVFIRAGTTGSTTTMTWGVWESVGGITVDERTITTTSTGYYRYSDYTRTAYQILSLTITESSSNRYVVSTAGTDQWIRVLNDNGTAAASVSVKIRAVFMRI